MRLRNLLLTVCLLFMFSTVAQAQTIVIDPTTHELFWRVPVQQGATVLPTAYQFLLSVDDGEAAVVTAPCVPPNPLPTTGAALWECTSALPALTPGSHTIKVFARVSTGGQEFTTAPSNTIAITSIFIAPPQDLVVRKKGGL